VPRIEEIFSPLLVALPLQMLAYFIAVKRGCDVDQAAQPRQIRYRRVMLYMLQLPSKFKDITLRALETLKSVDLIAAEDTRHTKNLLDAYEISKPLTSFF